MSEHEKVLVYYHRMEGGVATMTLAELNEKIGGDSTLRFTIKAVGQHQKNIEVLEKDINPNAEAVNAQQSVAQVAVPMSAFLSNAVSWKYKELYIVSKKA